MKYIILAVVIPLFPVFYGSSQESHFLTGQDKAYLFHTVKKSPILDLNFGRYFHYQGEMIYLANGDVNYDSLELMIINKPSLLKIYTSELLKSPKGLLAEAANKQAIWELNKVLLSYRKNTLLAEGLSSKFDSFFELMLEYVPTFAFKLKQGQPVLHNKLESFLNPSLAFNDKLAIITNFGNLSTQEMKSLVDGFNKCINLWVEKRALEIFQALGGEADIFINVLTAAGDGSSTSGLFEEREKDEKGRWNKGLPKAVGLFPYECEVVTVEKKRKTTEILKPLPYSIQQFETFGNNRYTNVHVDVWGYNSEKQTTVVLDKNGKSYPLFGSAESRFLSPDSSFSGKVTYYTMIQRVKADIVNLEEKISGKRGFDFKIEEQEKKKSGKLLQIKKLEKELSDARMSTIITNDKKYKTESGSKKRKKRQADLVNYYNQLQKIEGNIKRLGIEKEETIALIQIKNQQLFQMKSLIGEDWVPFKEENDLFIFEDGSTFDLLTQEFRFEKAVDPEVFEVRLIAIPYSHTSDQVDEVMLHINITDVIPLSDARIQLSLLDAFDSDDFKLSGALFHENDSIAVRQLFEQLLKKNIPLDFNVRGAGVGRWDGNQTVIDRGASELNRYPGANKAEQNSNRDADLFKRLRVSDVKIDINRKISFIVNSYTDPVKSNFIAPSELILSKQKQYGWTNNEVLSAYRSYTILLMLQKELNILAGKYLERNEAKIVIDRLNKSISKVNITVGKRSLKLKDFN